MFEQEEVEAMDGEELRGGMEQKTSWPELLLTGFLSSRHERVCLEGERWRRRPAAFGIERGAVV